MTTAINTGGAYYVIKTDVLITWVFDILFSLTNIRTKLNS